MNLKVSIMLGMNKWRKGLILTDDRARIWALEPSFYYFPYFVSMFEYSETEYSEPKYNGR